MTSMSVPVGLSTPTVPFIAALAALSIALASLHTAGASPAQQLVNHYARSSMPNQTIVMPVRQAAFQSLPATAGRSPQYLGTTSTLPGAYGGAQGISYDSLHKVFYVLASGTVYRVTPGGNATYIAFADNSAQGLAYDPVDNTIFVTVEANYDILAIDPTSGQQSVFAGGTQGTTDGQGTAASFQQPQGIVADPGTGALFVTDRDRIRAITISAYVTTLTAPGVIGPSNLFSSAPESITIDPSKGNLFVADPIQNIIHQVTPSGKVSTFSGRCFTRSQPGGCDKLQRDGPYGFALFAAPCGIAFDSRIGALYVADSANEQIRELLHGHVTTLAGNGHLGLTDGVGESVSFNFPIALAVMTGTDDVYVADQANSLIRVVESSGLPPPPPKHGVTLYDPPTIEAGPSGIAASAAGSIWFAESSANMIARMTPAGKIQEFHLRPGYAQPQLIALGSDNNIWFSNLHGAVFKQTGAIGRITPAGKITEFPLPSGVFLEALTLGPDGNIWFLIQQGGIGFITPSGTLRAFVSDQGAGITSGYDGDLWFTTVGISNGNIDRMSTSGHLDSEYKFAGFNGGAIARGPGRNMWVAQSVFVGYLRGKTLIEYPLPGCRCNYALSDLTEGGDGALWLTEAGTGYIGRMTPLGVYSSLIIPAPGSAPLYLTTAPNGVVWFTDTGSQKIGRVY